MMPLIIIFTVILAGVAVYEIRAQLAYERKYPAYEPSTEYNLALLQKLVNHGFTSVQRTTEALNNLGRAFNASNDTVCALHKLHREVTGETTEYNG